jgi:aspartyl protease family protein
MRLGMTSVRQRLLWIVLAGLAIACLILIARHGEGNIGSLSTGDFASLAYKIALLVFVGSAVLVMFRERFAQALIAAVLWVVLALVLVIGYAYRFELHDVADRVLAELMPGHVITRGRSVEVARAAGGDFDVTAQINGARVAMILDTGASSVVLTREDAKAAGLPLEVLTYTANIDTANGRTHAAPVTLDRIAVGGLVERSVDALVAQPGQLKTSLLGMSFLNRLQSWEVRGDRLLLRGYP